MFGRRRAVKKRAKKVGDGAKEKKQTSLGTLKRRTDRAIADLETIATACSAFAAFHGISELSSRYAC